VDILNPKIPVLNRYIGCDILGVYLNENELTRDLIGADVPITEVKLDLARHLMTACSASCGTNPQGDTRFISTPAGWTVGLLNHDRWADDWDDFMLGFLPAHPLSSSKWF
jgi:hypothetical protein